MKIFFHCQYFFTWSTNKLDILAPNMKMSPAKEKFPSLFKFYEKISSETC